MLQKEQRISTLLLPIRSNGLEYLLASIQMMILFLIIISSKEWDQQGIFKYYVSMEQLLVCKERAK